MDTSLLGLEALLLPSLVDDHLFNEVLDILTFFYKNAPPAEASRWLRAMSVSPW